MSASNVNNRKRKSGINATAEKMLSAHGDRRLLQIMGDPANTGSVGAYIRFNKKGVTTAPSSTDYHYWISATGRQVWMGEGCPCGEVWLISDAAGDVYTVLDDNPAAPDGTP